MAKQILIIEDDTIFGKNMAYILEYRGYESSLISSASKACEWISKGLKPALIFIDYHLCHDEINGIDCMKKMLKIDANLKIIIMSGLKTLNIKEDALKYGAVKFLKKPFEMEYILKLVERIV